MPRKPNSKPQSPEDSILSLSGTIRDKKRLFKQNNLQGNAVLAALKSEPATTLAAKLNVVPSTVLNWIEAGGVPNDKLYALSEVTDTDLMSLMNSAHLRKPQKHRGIRTKSRDLLDTLVELEPQLDDPNTQDAAIDAILVKHPTYSKQSLKQMIVRKARPFRLLRDELAKLTVEMPTPTDVSTLKKEVAATLGWKGVHELNEEMRKWGFEIPPTTKELLQAEKRARIDTLKYARPAIIRGVVANRYHAVQAAEMLETSEEMVWRYLRTSLSVLNITPRQRNMFPQFMLRAIAADCEKILIAAIDQTSPPLFSVPLVRMYDQCTKLAPITVQRIPAPPLTASFEELLPSLVSLEHKLEEVAQFKGFPVDRLTLTLTSLLSPFGLTWVMVEHMEADYRETLYQLLIHLQIHRKPT